MKQNYLTPLADVLPVRMEGVICGSYNRAMNFGGSNASGTIDNSDVVNGGSF